MDDPADPRAPPKEWVEALEEGRREADEGRTLDADEVLAELKAEISAWEAARAKAERQS